MIKGSSLFSQLLHHFSRTEFAHLVAKHQAERHSKGFTCWTQLVSMLFCHMAHADSLREICGGLACCIGKLRHLGITKAPNKSTLSYANKNRPAALYEELFWTMLQRFRTCGGPQCIASFFPTRLFSSPGQRQKKDVPTFCAVWLSGIVIMTAKSSYSPITSNSVPAPLLQSIKTDGRLRFSNHTASISFKYLCLIYFFYTGTINPLFGPIPIFK
jgi:hypothetical protein